MLDRNITQGHHSQYFEVNHGTIINYPFNKEEVIGAIDEWYRKQSQTEVHILVVCAVRTDIENDIDFKLLENYYEGLPENWKPYAETSIIHLLQEFSKKSNLAIKIWVVNKLNWNKEKDEEAIRDLQHTWADKLICITDGIALLQKENKTIKKAFISKGYFMMPICEKIDKKTAAKIVGNFKDDEDCEAMYSLFYKHIKEKCLRIELEVPNKDLFFRRLRNFISLLIPHLTSDINYPPKSHILTNPS